MRISQKIKTINNKIEQNKAEYNLDRQTAKIFAFLSGNNSKHEVLTGKDALPEKGLLEKAVTLKIFEYAPLSKEFKAQTRVAGKQYQGFNKLFKHDKKEEPLEIK